MRYKITEDFRFAHNGIRIAEYEADTTVEVNDPEFHEFVVSAGVAEVVETEAAEAANGGDVSSTDFSEEQLQTMDELSALSLKQLQEIAEGYDLLYKKVRKQDLVVAIVTDADEEDLARVISEYNEE